MYKLHTNNRIALCAITWLYVSFGAVAQQSQEAPLPQPDINFWLGEQTRYQATHAELQEQLNELQRQLDADPHKALRESIQDHERFAMDVRRLRSEADRFTRPSVARAFDWVAHDVNEKIAALKRDLTARERATDGNQAALRRQIADKQKDIASIAQGVKAINDTIRILREERRLDSKLAELDALGNTPGRGVISGQPPPAPVVREPIKDKP